MTNNESILLTQVLENQHLNGSINYKQNTRNWHESEKHYQLRTQQDKVETKSNKAVSFFDLSLVTSREQRKAKSNEYYRYGF